MYQQPTDFLSIAVPIAIVLLSLTFHEAAHAWTAERLGDPTARQLGRVSLNPLVHIDFIGTVLLPLLAAISNLPIIGWAKPVPVDIRRLRQPRRDFMLVAAAGPASNILLAAAGALVVHATGAPSFGRSPLLEFIEINILLAMFNLVPVPPLDGGNVLAGLLPPPADAAFQRLRPFGILILYALMFTGVLSAIIMPPARLLWGLLLP
jgi:Zn-dependent protease